MSESGLNLIDQKWIDALRPFWGGGTVPYWKTADGYIDAQKTINWMMQARNQKKIGPNGEELEWPAISNQPSQLASR